MGAGTLPWVATSDCHPPRDHVGGSVVYCDVTERNRVAMSRHRHNVASHHYDES
jgi:hypothetical protein